MVTAVKMRLFNGRVLTYPAQIEVKDGMTMSPVWRVTTNRRKRPRNPLMWLTGGDDMRGSH